MKRILWFAILGTLLAAPSWLVAQEGYGNYDHATVGIFADYFRFAPASNSHTNFIGFGARAAVNTGRFVQIEGEMNYDFERNFTTINSNGGTTSFTTTRLRPLTGLFGPKFSTSGPFKFYGTTKVGFINFTETRSAVTPGTVGSAISSVGGPGTHFAVYPGVGVEGFWGPFGLRAEVGDQVYFSNGTFNNLRVTFGPQLRF